MLVARVWQGGGRHGISSIGAMEPRSRCGGSDRRVQCSATQSRHAPCPRATTHERAGLRRLRVASAQPGSVCANWCTTTEAVDRVALIDRGAAAPVHRRLRGATCSRR